MESVRRYVRYRAKGRELINAKRLPVCWCAGSQFDVLTTALQRDRKANILKTNPKEAVDEQRLNIIIKQSNQPEFSSAHVKFSCQEPNQKNKLELSPAVCFELSQITVDLTTVPQRLHVRCIVSRKQPVYELQRQTTELICGYKRLFIYSFIALGVSTKIQQEPAQVNPTETETNQIGGKKLSGNDVFSSCVALLLKSIVCSKPLQTPSQPVYIGCFGVRYGLSCCSERYESRMCTCSASLPSLKALRQAALSSS